MRTFILILSSFVAIVASGLGSFDVGVGIFGGYGTSIGGLGSYDLGVGPVGGSYFKLDSLQLVEFDLVGSFAFAPDSVIIGGEKATISNSTTTGFTAVTATPLSWSRVGVDVEIYQSFDGYCSYNWLYYSRRVFDSRLNTGVGF